MRVVDRALGLLDANGAQVKGLWIFLLQLQMGNVRVCCQPCTRYRIGQARAAALPDVMLDNNALRRRIGHDKVARKACSLLAGGNEYKVHRLVRSEEHTSELQSLMSISYSVFCLKKKKQQQ